MTLYQHAKDQLISSFCSRDISDLKILQSDWPGVFWPISQISDFSQTWDLFWNIANNTNFIIPNSGKINFQIFQ